MEREFLTSTLEVSDIIYPLDMKIGEDDPCELSLENAQSNDHKVCFEVFTSTRLSVKGKSRCL